MASIQKLKRKNGVKYRAFVRRNGKRPASKVFEKRKDAVAWARVMEGNDDHLEAFPDAEARKRTVADVCDGFMLDYGGRDTAIVGRLSWWRDYYGNTRLASFSQATIKEGLRALRREHAKRAAGRGKSVSLGRKRGPATQNRYLGAISIALTWAVDQGWIVKNPAVGISRKKEPGGRVRWLSDDERERLLAACDKSDWRDLGLLVRLALSTGARQGELLALRWSNVDLKKGLAHIGTSKSGEPRVLPLIDSLKQELIDRPRPIRDELLFRSPRDPNQPFHFRPHWEMAVERAGLKDFRFHDLRHTTASYLAMNGASLLEIADVLGHKTLQMVKRYSHLATEHKQQLVGRVFGDMVG